MPLSCLAMLPCLVTLFCLFRWFKFTLKPPDSITPGNLLLAIWDTSHWNFFVKFGLKTAWHISYDILWSLLTYVNFWKFSQWRSDQWLMRLGGFRWADNRATWWYHFFGGATHLRGGGGRRKKRDIFQDICDGLKSTRNWPIWPRISP